MAKHIKITLAKNGVIVPAAIRAYLEDTLSPEQRAEFERLIEQDPFSADALEGLRNSGSTSDSFLSVEEITNAVRTKTGVSGSSKTIQLHWSVYAYAAALTAIVAGIALVFSFYKSQPSGTQLAEITILEQDTVPSFQESVAVSDTAVSTVKIDSAVTSVAVPTEKKDTVASSPKTGSSTTALLAQNKKEETPRSEANTPAAPPNIKALRTETPSENTTDKKEKTAEETTDDGMTAFNNSEYGKAEKLFSSILEKSPNNANALYFGAVSAYINGNTLKAEKQFDQLMKNGLYTEGSKWYKANILLKRGDKDEALEILRSLSISNGTYKTRAIKKLEEVE